MKKNKKIAPLAIAAGAMLIGSFAFFTDQIVNTQNVEVAKLEIGLDGYDATVPTYLIPGEQITFEGDLVNVGNIAGDVTLKAVATGLPTDLTAMFGTQALPLDGTSIVLQDALAPQGTIDLSQLELTLGENAPNTIQGAAGSIEFTYEVRQAGAPDTVPVVLNETLTLADGTIN